MMVMALILGITPLFRKIKFVVGEIFAGFFFFFFWRDLYDLQVQVVPRWNEYTGLRT